MSERRRAATWLAQAQNDAAHARYALQGGFHAHACYGAQQAVEKALKALLLHAGGDIGRTHSVVGLRRALAEAGVVIPENVLSMAEAQELTRHNIETRYPLGDAEDPPFALFGPEQAGRAVDCAERVLEMAKQALAL